MAINLKPTPAMAEEARRGLEWRREFNRGGTEVGVARARDISNRTNLSRETIGRMVSYFARHEVDKQGEGFSPGEDGYPSAGRIAWALWGGDPGASWARSKYRQLTKEPENMDNIIQIENKGGKVRLNETVTKDSIGRMIEEIGRLFGAKAAAEGADFGTIMNAAENGVDVLDIEINSPGGSVFDGYTIYNEIMALRDRGVTVNARITGMAASMASVIAMAATRIFIAKHGRMMIHDASGGIMGNADELRKQADLLDSISADIANIYADRTGKDVSDVRAMMKKETWMNAATALENKFADEIIGSTAQAEASEKNIVDENLQMQLSCANKDQAMFETRNKLTAKITALETENTELREEITDLTAQVEEFSNASETVAGLNTQIETITAELATEKANFATAQAEWTEKEAQFATDLAQAQAKSSPEAIQAAVTVELAKCSHKPVEFTSEVEHTQSKSKELTLEAFNQLTPADRMTFVKSGGKITE